MPAASLAALAVAAAVPEPAAACSTGPFSAHNPPPACWRPYNAASPFNQRLPSRMYLVRNSARIVRRTLRMGPITGLNAGVADTRSDWAHPTYWARASDPRYRVRCLQYACHSIEGHHIHIPRAARPAGGGDGHLTVVQPDGWEYDFWQARRSRRDGVLRVSGGGRTHIAGDGLAGHPNANAARWGLMAGMIRARELLAGRIDHALVVAVGCSNGTWVYPAAGRAARCRSGHHDAPAAGQRFWLQMTDAEIAGLHAPLWKKTILRALARYGAFVGDTGGNEALSFSFESGSTFTSFGLPDPVLIFARRISWAVRFSGGRYRFDLASDVPWRSRLRVVAPCVTARTC